MDPETFRLLEEADWGEIGKELYAFAVWWARKYQWRYGKGQDLALGKSIDDIVQEVIVKTLQGDRKWDPERGALVPWLKDQVKSIMDALARSAAHRYERESLESMNEEGVGDKAEYQASKSDVHTPLQSPDPKEAVLQQEDVEHQVDALYQAMDGDQELEEILSAILDGCERKPKLLAAELGVPVKDINNRLKRILRRAAKVKGGA